MCSNFDCYNCVTTAAANSMLNCVCTKDNGGTLNSIISLDVGIWNNYGILFDNMNCNSGNNPGYCAWGVCCNTDCTKCNWQGTDGCSPCDCTAGNCAGCGLG